MPGVPEFRFFTDHGNTLLLIFRDPGIQIREIAKLLDITECVAQRVVTDLSEAGYVDVGMEGHRNIFSVRTDAPLPLPLRRDANLRALLGLLREHDSKARTSREK
jgi:DNA-binding transcriptional regulator LsrR (DeoR family)